MDVRLHGELHPFRICYLWMITSYSSEPPGRKANIFVDALNFMRRARVSRLIFRSPPSHSVQMLPLRLDMIYAIFWASNNLITMDSA